MRTHAAEDSTTFAPSHLAPSATESEPAKPQDEGDADEAALQLTSEHAPPDEAAFPLTSEHAPPTEPTDKAASRRWSEYGDFYGTYDVTLHLHTPTQQGTRPPGLEHYQLSLDVKGEAISAELLKVGENNTLFPASKRQKVPLEAYGAKRILHLKTLPGAGSEGAAVPRHFRIAFQLGMEDRPRPQPPSFYGLWRDGLDQQAPSQWGPLKGALRQKAPNRVKLIRCTEPLARHRLIEAQSGVPAFTLTECEVGKEGGMAFIHDPELHTFMTAIEGIPKTALNPMQLASAFLSEVYVDWGGDKPFIRGTLMGRVVNLATQRRLPTLDYILPVLLTFNDQGHWELNVEEPMIRAKASAKGAC